MDIGDYFYYRDNRYEYIMKVTGHLDFQKTNDIYLNIIKCSNDKFDARKAIWNCALLVHDCKDALRCKNEKPNKDICVSRDSK